MNMELTNEQIARVFAMYLGCYFIDEGWKESRKCLYPHEMPHSCKLLLKPLSAITDEDAIEVAKIMDMKPEGRRSRKDETCGGSFGCEPVFT